MLEEKRRELVLELVAALTDRERVALEQVMIGALANDKNKKHGPELRRVIRFVRHAPQKLKDPATTRVSGGAREAREEVIPGGVVTLLSGVRIVGVGEDAYGLIYTGPREPDMRWLQFIWRQLMVKRRGKETARKMRIHHPSGGYELTVDPKRRPRWNADSSSTRQPFYEEDTTAIRRSGVLAMFDLPSSMQQTVEKLFASTSPPDSVVSRFHAVTYLIDGMDVLYRAEIEYEWNFTSAREPPLDFIMSGSAKNAGLDPQHRARLALQFPDLDYLPGPPIPAPLPKEEFEPVLELEPAGWDTKTRPEQYADVAKLAGADWIESVSKPDNINNTSPPKLPGLNYQALLDQANSDKSKHPSGETGYIHGATKAYTNPELPADRFAALPTTAMVLSAQAFEHGSPAKPREKAYALATMRHEMMHATHNELAIGWLAKWRDDLTEESFEDWLTPQKGKGISELDFELVSSGFPPFDVENVRATEMLAWTEGFVTALPFLSPQPALPLLHTKETWPAAISELAGAARLYKSDSHASKAALERVHRAVCGLTEPQRTTVIAWLKALLKPRSLNPTPGNRDDQRAVTLVDDSFPDDFIKDVLAAAQKQCPR